MLKWLPDLTISDEIEIDVLSVLQKMKQRANFFWATRYMTRNQKSIKEKPSYGVQKTYVFSACRTLLQFYFAIVTQPLQLFRFVKYSLALK